MKTLIGSFVGILLGVLFSHPACADHDQTVPLISPQDITLTGQKGFQGVSGSASGAIHYPDEILAYPVVETNDNKQLLEAWKGSHRFFVIPIEIAIAPSPDMVPERVDVQAIFPGLGQLERQPLIIDIFPKTGFKPGPVKGEVKLGADLKFNHLVTAATAGVNATFTYSPFYASVVSGFGSGTAFWQLIKTQDKQPTGSLPMKLVIACPLSISNKDVILTFDVRVQYEGPWWQTGETVATFRTRVRFPV